VAVVTAVLGDRRYVTSGRGPSVDGLELLRLGDTATLALGGTLRFVHNDSSTAFTLERSQCDVRPVQGAAAPPIGAAAASHAATGATASPSKRARVDTPRARRMRVLSWNTSEHDTWGGHVIRAGVVLAGRSQEAVTRARAAVVVAASPDIVSLQEGHCGESGFDATKPSAVAAELCSVHSFTWVGAVATHQGCVELLVSTNLFDELSPITVEAADADGMLSSVVAHCWCGADPGVTPSPPLHPLPPLTLCAAHLVPGGPKSKMPMDRLNTNLPRTAWAKKCAAEFGTDLRAEQVRQLLSLLRTAGACVLAGDLNVRDVGAGKNRGMEDAARKFFDAGWVDGAADAGNTFDQLKNPFQDEIPYPQERRYDRVYLRGRVTPVSASVLHCHLPAAQLGGPAKKPASCPYLHLSDHFGVLMECDVELPII
jgi:hypothetical protein